MQQAGRAHHFVVAPPGSARGRAGTRRRDGAADLSAGAGDPGGAPSLMLYHGTVSTHLQAIRKHGIQTQRRRRDTSLQGAATCTARPEHLHALKRLGRPRSEAVQCKLRLLVGLNVNDEVVVLLLGRLALPI
jgi:hypothetical protein